MSNAVSLPFLHWPKLAANELSTRAISRCTANLLDLSTCHAEAVNRPPLHPPWRKTSPQGVMPLDPLVGPVGLSVGVIAFALGMHDRFTRSVFIRRYLVATYSEGLAGRLIRTAPF
jgi:hypothetical protein